MPGHSVMQGSYEVGSHNMLPPASGLPKDAALGVLMPGVFLEQGNHYDTHDDKLRESLSS